MTVLRLVATLISLLGLSLTSSAASARVTGELPSVLLLLPLRSRAPSSEIVESAFRRTLERAYGGPVDLRVEFLDLATAEETPYLDAVTNLLAAKYARDPLDVVVAHRAEALEFVVSHRSRVFPGVPIVFLDVNAGAFRAMTGLPADLTGALIAFDANRAVRQTLGLMPAARRVTIVGGASKWDAGGVETARAAIMASGRQIAIESLAGLPLDEQLQRVARLPPNGLIIVPTYRADTLGRSMIASEVVGQIAAAASVPTFGYAEGWMGRGIVGGELIRYEVLADRAGVMAARILKGEAAASIPIDDAPATGLIFDARQLRRWNIDEAGLPAGSDVRYREPTLWSEYRVQILAVAGLLAGQAALIGALLIERRRRRRAQNDVIDAEQRYRTVADFTTDWVFWIRTDGSFAYVSPSCDAVTGYPADAFIERPTLMDDLVFADDRARWAAHREQALSSDETLSLEMRITTPSGELRWLDVVSKPIVGPGGSRLGVRGAARDVTERKQSEQELRHAVEEIGRLRDELETDNIYLRQEMTRESAIDGVLGGSDVMRYVVSKVQQVAPTSSTVLLLGETGVGKSQLARALHDLSPRRGRPLITLNCAALPPTLVESELFGHEKGAFTSAHSRRVGRFESANGGTLFLDEISELPLELQGKLLRAVQDGEFERVGSNVPLKTDVRLIVATNRHLESEVRAGRFRQDLWYRLNIFPITVPPLRQRVEDIPLLVAHFVDKHSRKLGRPIPEVSKATMKALLQRHWPGNVRELENAVERALIVTNGPRLDLDEQPPDEPAAIAAPLSFTGGVLTLEDLERKHVIATLERLHWRVEGADGAAMVLGINASTLRSRMRKLGIHRPGTAPLQRAEG